MERNEWRRPNLDALKSLLIAYGVDDPAERLAVLTLAREARQRGWWEEYRDVWPGGSLPEFEAEARKILTFELALIPGLLQTADYARAVFRGGRVVDEAAMERRVEARMARQRILDRENPPYLWALVDEAALRRHVGGPDVMRAQLHHLADAAARPNITIQVLPFAAGAHAAMESAFTILEFHAADDPTLVYVENIAADTYLELDEQVAGYSLAYDHARASALSADASAAYLADLADRFK